LYGVPPGSSLPPGFLACETIVRRSQAENGPTVRLPDRQDPLAPPRRVILTRRSPRCPPRAGLQRKRRGHHTPPP